MAGKSNKSGDELKIMMALDKFGPMICDEVEQTLGMIHQTASARMSEMWDKKFIKWTGEIRQTRRERAAKVFAINPSPKKKEE